MKDDKQKTWAGGAGTGGLALCLLLLPGCQQQMAEQPSYRPLEPSAFFADGRSARPLPPGTVAQGQLRDDWLLFTRKEGNRQEAARAASLAGFGILGPLPTPALTE